MTTFIVLTLPNIGLVNRIPLWLTVLVISRDVGIVLTVAIVNLAVGPRTFKPSPLGKAATAIFILACVVVMLFNYLGYHSRWVDAAIRISLVITLASGVDYVWRIARIINSRRTRDAASALRCASLVPQRLDRVERRGLRAGQ